MAEKGLLITKFPYLSYAKNIIECFSIIGYEEKHLPEIINEYKITKEQNYSPAIISSIISNEDFGIIDNDFIISQIFPDNPKFILKSKINSSNEEPKPKNIIFTLTTDSQDSPVTETKLFYTCFAFVFYEIYIYENNSVSEEYFIPKSFCIISQYSFFGFFKHICLNLYNLFLKNSTISSNKFPLEIVIYNIVNFTPSPIKHNINYNLFKDILDVPSYYIHQLSGYPLLDFNVFDIFNVLPVRFFIEIYLYTVLEQSILFFSSNLEILNLVMFIFYSFNYPCNNSTYFWHIVSISNKDLNEENRFVGQIMSSMLGVSCEYDESIDTSAFGYYHFIVDIDNKKLILKANNNTNDDDKKIFSLYNYIHNIIDEKEVQSLFLKKYIDRLVKLVDNIFKDIDFDNTKGKGIDFFGRINRVKNNNIQEYFYNFIINLLLVIYQNTNLDFSISNIKIELNKKFYFKKNNESLLIKDEEKLFCKFFKNTSKYKIFFENFLTKYESDKLFKIPLLFCEEFVNLKIKSNQNRIPLKLPYFYCMDNLYTLSSTEVKMLELYHFSFKYSNDELKIELMKADQKRESISNQKNKSLFNFNKKVMENNDEIINYKSKSKFAYKGTTNENSKEDSDKNDKKYLDLKEVKQNNNKNDNVLQIMKNKVFYMNNGKKVLMKGKKNKAKKSLFFPGINEQSQNSQNFSSFNTKSIDKFNNSTHDDKIIINEKNKQDYLMKSDYELNNLSYEDAKNEDKRTFLQYYYSLIKSKHILFFVFKPKIYFNSRIINICYFLFLLSLCFTFNTMFVDENTIHNIYISKGSFDLLFNLTKIIGATFILYIFQILFYFLITFENIIIKIKENDKDAKNFFKKIHTIINHITIKIILFYTISLIILFICLIYVGCFAAIFPKTKIHLFIRTIVSLGFSLIIPLILYLISSVLRIYSLEGVDEKREDIYIISQYLQYM